MGCVSNREKKSEDESNEKNQKKEKVYEYPKLTEQQYSLLLYEGFI